MIRRSKTYIAIPPGETIKECLEYRGISKKDFREKTGFSLWTAKQVLNGEIRIGFSIAARLEKVLGIPADFWMRLEAVYRKNLELVEEENANNK